MEAYINAAACISAQPTYRQDYFFEELRKPHSGFFHVDDAPYEKYIPAANLRRASRILKMGITAGRMCLQQTGSETTDAIVTGTGMGCFEDTDKFLRAMDEQQETLLAPTPFIQSTHNTVAGQLALLTKCQGYNFTYAHQNLSFESALLDGMLLLAEGSAKNVLVGAVDELTPALAEMFERAGHIKKDESAKQIATSSSAGYAAGEGAAFFSLSFSPGQNCLARVKGLLTIQKLNRDLQLTVEQFIEIHGLKFSDVDLLLSGRSGDLTTDQPLAQFENKQQFPIVHFKELCGEFFASSGFAFWLATQVLYRQDCPANLISNKVPAKKLKNVLIINHYQDKHYSLILLQQC